jgi:uncharacterized protein (TIGR02678 family)
MQLDKLKQRFDELAKEAAEYLLESFWVLRAQEPEKYQLIREREHVLRLFFLEKMGLRLVVHRHFAKLEKVPVEPESWMGIETFQHPRDYALLCCLLAYLESKSVDEQFLLSDLCEELQSLYPHNDALDWTQYEHRKSLVRTLQFAEELGLVRVVDGEIESFSFAEDQEVLYEAPVVSRYFMRSYPKDLFQFSSLNEILEAEWQHDGHDKTAERRHRVYRRLMFSPAMYGKGAADEDFQYVRQYRHRIREDIETFTDYQFELYKQVAMLTAPERKSHLTLFPDHKAVMDIALQFAGVVRSRRDEEQVAVQPDGTVKLTWIDFEQWMSICQEQFRHGWSKQYREMPLGEVAHQVYQLLAEWQLAATDPETGQVILYPALVRLSGRYPADFHPEQSIEDEGTHQVAQVPARSG